MMLTLESLVQQLNCEAVTNVFFLICSPFCGQQVRDSVCLYFMLKMSFKTKNPVSLFLSDFSVFLNI